jgi:cell division protein FtsB
MPRRIPRFLADAAIPTEPEAADAPADGAPQLEASEIRLRPGGPDLAAFPVLGITRRRMAFVLGAILAAWIIIVFARQVSEAAAATTRADTAAESNAALRQDVGALKRELQLIQRQEYILQQARGYGLGAEDEIPFTLAADAPSLADDAPGSASVRVGAALEHRGPLDTWLSLLFGSGV